MAGAISAKVELDTDPTFDEKHKRSNTKLGSLTKDMKRSSLGMAAAKEKVIITMRYLKVSTCGFALNKHLKLQSTDHNIYYLLIQ